MVADEGKLPELTALESAVREDAKGSRGSRKKGKDADAGEAPADAATAKWLEREWLQRWLRIEPFLAALDLRPYVFVARDKRMLTSAAELGGLGTLIDKLCGSEMAARSVEPEVKALTASDAEQVFTALKERVISHGSFSALPPGFEGLSIVAKHHPRFQTELLSLLAGIDVGALGMWVVKGWNETLTEAGAQEQLRGMMTQWAAQDGNTLLKRAATGAIASCGGEGLADGNIRLLARSRIEHPACPVVARRADTRAGPAAFGWRGDAGRH